jgi:hypothetical protein
MAQADLAPEAKPGIFVFTATVAFIETARMIEGSVCV